MQRLGPQDEAAKASFKNYRAQLKAARQSAVRRWRFNN
jgi:hypothetical protein